MFTVHIAGHLGKDPETRFTPGGQKVTTFAIATNVRKGKEDVTIWVRVTVWGDRFDKMLPYLKKGSAVIVTGRMMPPSSYTDKEGRTQISLEITAEMIEFSPFGKGERAGGLQPGTGGYTQSGHANGGASDDEGQFQTGGGAYFNKSSGSYGASSALGQGAHASSIDEDGLPF